MPCRRRTRPCGARTAWSCWGRRSRWARRPLTKRNPRMTLSLDDYQQQIAATRPERMRWWHDARFGMFIHWGLYSQLGRHEWVMNRERIPIPEYETLAPTWRP